MKFKKILVLVAMMKEAQAIAQQFQMKEIDHSMDRLLPAHAFQIELDEGTITLIVSGKCQIHGVDRIGSQGMNLVAWEALRAFKPDLLINAGTAGGFQKKGAVPGDIYVSKDTIKYHDRLLYPDMHFLNYGVGSYRCLAIPHIAKQLGFKEGVISSGSSLLFSQQESDQMLRNNTSVKEMEAAGIAEVAEMRKVPFIALKIITDLVDTSDCPQTQFTTNFNWLISHLAEKLQKLCRVMMTESIKEDVFA